MEHALGIPEIRQYICSQVDEKPTLAALARTCIAFKDLSLEMLWSGRVSSISFGELWRALPNLFVTDEASGEIVDVSIRSSQDWNRLHAFTHKIRCLSFYEGSYSVSDVALNKLISPPSSLERLFPRLRILDVDGEAPDLVRTYLRFLSAHLRHFMLVSTPQSCHIPTRILPIMCPQLQVLDVSNVGWPDRRGSTLVKEVSAAVVQLPFLTTLRCPDLTPTALLFISRLHDLRELQLTNMHQTPVGATGETETTRLTFNAIEEIGLHPFDIHSAMVFLRRLDTRPRTLEIKEASLPYEDLVLVKELFALLGQMTRRQYDLEELCLHGRIIWPVCYPSPQSTNPNTLWNIDLFRQLAHYRELRRLSLWIPFDIELSQANVKELAHGFPKLEVLEFSTLSYSTITADDLIGISDACPKLTTINVPIHSWPSEFNRKLAATDSFRTQSHVLSVKLTTSFLSDTDRLTQTLSAFFPFIRKLDLHDIENGICEEPTPITATTIVPLMRLSQLTSLSLALRHRRMELSEADVLDLAKALPHLTSLSLFGSISTGYEGFSLSLGNVLRLTDLCPNLSDLATPFRAYLYDRSISRNRFEALRVSPRNHALNSLRLVIFSKPGNAYLVDLVIILAAAFARLETLRLEMPLRSPPPGRSIRLSDAVKKLRKVVDLGDIGRAGFGELQLTVAGMLKDSSLY
ncbi:hypothetical protein CONPUDRAFT_160895 [Coniophora puteana RWD-64-598 SS2]|uniref:F-box domain-containing protein n=1 Tax=Coniophora puteana (strain RWD-64-598) TaxID=741705 RepID=A0A5M3N419_CONPW|nr:uncharacterized protein CONPUDRAFT_160895 [Coniophora puteana RWD-64-598 SS2]EIW85997.1 hypothetical protein CONPUDRAFT_160895 [Coniophora puteana RWD-64-598 SS2]